MKLATVEAGKTYALQCDHVLTEAERTRIIDDWYRAGTGATLLIFPPSLRLTRSRRWWHR